MRLKTPARSRTLPAKLAGAFPALFAGALLAGALAVAPGTGQADPARAVTGVDQIAETCGSQAVCLFDGASVSNATELQGVLPEGVRVVVIPRPDQAESVQSSEIAAGLKTRMGAETVIVIEDHAKDRFAVASDDDATAITEALYSQNQADGGLAVAGISETLAQVGGPGETAAAPAVGGVAVVGGIVLAVAVVAAGGVWLVLRSRRRASGRAGAISAKLERELSAALDGPDGAYVVEAIEQLDRRAAAFPDLSERIVALRQHVSELFVRVRKRGTDQQIRLLQAQYKDTLSKLLKALDDDYYGDILRNPQYWSQPAERLAEVRRAVDSVDQQAVENIRQVNESRDLEFKVALDSLIKTVSEAKLSDVYRDRED